MSLPETSWLYQFSSLTISLILFFSIILFNEIGFYLGRYVQKRTSDDVKSLTGSIQASILGLLALLLGFTFSMSMQRYDDRSMALIQDSNTIQEVQWRTGLLPELEQTQVNAHLNKYIQAKINLAQTSIVSEERRLQLLAEAKRIHRDLMSVTNNADFNNSVIAMIMQHNTRNALIDMHVPDVVLILLFIVFVASVGILGYSVGLSGTRMLVQITMVSLLITLIVFIIIDLDRPKRGLIKVDQSHIYQLQDTHSHSGNNGETYDKNN
jgi:hypothetical protein